MFQHSRSALEHEALGACTLVGSRTSTLARIARTNTNIRPGPTRSQRARFALSRSWVLARWFHSLATHGQTRVTPTPCLRSAQAASLVVRLWPQQGPTSVWLASCLSMKLPCACTQVCKHPYKNLDLRARRQVGTLGFVQLGTTDLQIFDFIRRARLRAPRCR